MKKKYNIYTMNLSVLNITSCLILIAMLIVTALINRNLLLESLNIKNFFIFIFAFFAYTLIHELLHAFSYVIHGAKYENITFGISLEKGILYCLCRQNISKKNILISLLYPFTIIGIITYIISLILNLKTLMLLSILNISGCAGDLIMFAFIYKLKNIEYSEFDDETSFGIYTEEEIDKRPFGLKYVGAEDKLNNKDKKKLRISKLSKIILIGLLALGTLDIILK